MKPQFAIVAFALLFLAALKLRPDLAAIAAPGTTGKPASEWAVSTHWINSPPLNLADLRGKVVLLDFWTYSCINCLRTVPYLNRWHQRYEDQGLVVIGIHTPEFEFENSHLNVEDAVRRLGIQFPVAQDNDYVTWNRYANAAWPAFYLIDRDNRIAYMRYGEGGYGEMENRIRQLLGVDSSVARDDGPNLSRVQTPEIYLGTAHGDHLALRPDRVRDGEFALVGAWSRVAERARLVGDGGAILLRFNAAKVHLVAGAAAPSEIVVRVDGGPPQRVSVERPRLYTLYDGNDYREHVLRIEIPTRGFDAYSFTFG